MAVSASMPLLTTTTCLTLSPPIFSIFACGRGSARRRCAWSAWRAGCRATWPIWKSLSPKSVISLSFSSTAADVPLKSKRVPISLAVWSTAFFTSTRLGSRRCRSWAWSGSPATCRTFGRGRRGSRKFSHANRCRASSLQALQHLRPAARSRSTLVRIASDADVRRVVDDPELGRAPKFVLGGGSNIVLTRDMPQVVLKVEVQGHAPRRGDAPTPGSSRPAPARTGTTFVAWTLDAGLPGPREPGADSRARSAPRRCRTSAPTASSCRTASSRSTPSTWSPAAASRSAPRTAPSATATASSSTSLGAAGSADHARALSPAAALAAGAGLPRAAERKMAETGNRDARRAPDLRLGLRDPPRQAARPGA